MYYPSKMKQNMRKRGPMESRKLLNDANATQRDISALQKEIKRLKEKLSSTQDVIKHGNDLIKWGNDNIDGSAKTAQYIQQLHRRISNLKGGAYRG